MKWFWGHYLARKSDANNPYASPLKAADFCGLPAALVTTATAFSTAWEGCQVLTTRWPSPRAG